MSALYLEVKLNSSTRLVQKSKKKNTFNDNKQELRLSIILFCHGLTWLIVGMCKGQLFFNCSVKGG